MSRTTTWLSAALLSLVLTIGACGGGDDEESGGTPPLARGGAAPSQTSPSSKADGRSQAERPSEGSSEGSDSSDGSDSSEGSDGSQESDSPGNPGRPEPQAAKGVRTTLSTFLEGMSEEDARKVCSTYTRQTRQLVGSALATDCVRGMKYAFRLIVPAGKQGAFTKVRVRSVDASGTKATARLRIPKELLAVPTLTFIARKGRIGLRKESGEWRVELLSLL